MKQIEQFNDIILRILRFLAESSEVTKLELFQRFPHCKSGFSRCTDSTRLRQDSATGHQNWNKTVVKPKVCISSLLTESAGVTLPQCEQRIHPV